MKTTQLKRLRQWFDEYVQSFVGKDDDGYQFYQIKVEHSRRVAREMRRLARALKWLPMQVNVAEAVGWLHDIGRFTQFQEFGTFHDAQSVDHGKRGWDVLKQKAVLSSLTSSDQHAVLTAVHYHNAKAIPGHIEGRPLVLLKLIRDADKLDIFHIVNEALTKDGFQDLPQMLPQVRLDGPLNPVVLDSMRRDHVCSFEEVKSLADFLLLQLSWIYDINYRSTCHQIIRRNIIAKIAAKMPGANSDIGPLFDEAKDYVRIRAGDWK